MKNKIAAILNLVEPEHYLGALTERRPVASLPFGCRYRLIDFPFSALFNAQVDSAGLFIPDSGHSLYDHIRSGYSWGLDNEAGGGVFTHSHIRIKADQTLADGISSSYYKDHETYVRKSDAKYIVLMGSQLLMNMYIRAVLHVHIDTGSDMTVAYKKVPRNLFREDSVYDAYEFSSEDSVRISGITELADIPHTEQKIAAGLDFLLIESELFLHYLKRLKERNLLVNMENIVRLGLEDGRLINGYEYTGYMRPIEDVRSYYQANMDLLDSDTFDSLFYRESPVLTKSKNSAPTYYGEFSKVTQSIFANDCEIYGIVDHSLVFRKSSLYQDTTVRNSIIFQGGVIDEGAYLDHVILDKGVYVEKGAQLIGTADNPLVVPKHSRVLSNGEIRRED